MSILSHFTRREIAQLFKSARRVVRHEACDILIAREKKSIGRLLVVTPARIGNAVKRNKIRRQLKALFYEEKYFDRGLDCIIVIKQVGTTFDQLRALLAQAFATKAQT